VFGQQTRRPEGGALHRGAALVQCLGMIVVAHCPCAVFQRQAGLLSAVTQIGVLRHAQRLIEAAQSSERLSADRKIAGRQVVEGELPPCRTKIVIHLSAADPVEQRIEGSGPGQDASTSTASAARRSPPRTPPPARGPGSCPRPGRSAAPLWHAERPGSAPRRAAVLLRQHHQG